MPLLILLIVRFQLDVGCSKYKIDNSSLGPCNFHTVFVVHFFLVEIYLQA